MTDNINIKEVILFPAMKPVDEDKKEEKKEEPKEEKKEEPKEEKKEEPKEEKKE